MWNTTILISQLFVIPGVICFGTTYLLKNKLAILFLNIGACIFYALQYVVVAKYTPMLIDFLSIIRCVWFYLLEKKEKKNDLPSLIIFSSIFLIAGIITFQTPLDILPIVASLIFNLSIWHNNVLTYKILAFPVSLCWIIYNSYFTLWGAVIAECIIVSFEIVGIIKYFKLKHTSQPE